MTTIANNLQQVNDRISEACRAAGRAREEVALLAVSKTFGADAVAEAAAAGQRAFGENYIQEGVDKILALRQQLPFALQWHCIGPVQSNKTRLVAEHFDWAHTAGVVPQDALELALAVAKLPRLQLRGLMSIPDASPDFDAQKAVHSAARALFDRIRKALVDAGIPGAEGFDTLSLGMTADMDAAIQAGSTLVRVGTGVFGGLHRTRLFAAPQRRRHGDRGRP
eukprot:gene23390-29605_t